MANSKELENAYDMRCAYNAALFNLWHKLGMYQPCKSFRHSDGSKCLGDDDWFVVAAMLPGGLISNRYHRLKWDMFDIPAFDVMPHEYDGHGVGDVLMRLAGASLIDDGECCALCGWVGDAYIECGGCGDTVWLIEPRDYYSGAANPRWTCGG